MLRIERFAQAVLEHVADGCAHVSKAELAERLKACESCEHRVGLICTHHSCGCFLWLKARWRSEKCPYDPPRWPPPPPLA
jgi:hypothetical protein